MLATSEEVLRRAKAYDKLVGDLKLPTRGLAYAQTEGAEYRVNENQKFLSSLGEQL